MGVSDKPLPDFDNPPVVEMALSVQFDSITNLRTPQLGLLWQEFRDTFSVTEDRPPLQPVLEKFGANPLQRSNARFELKSTFPASRCWFLNQDGTELIQVQQDYFAHNWRKADETGIYPRYAEYLRPRFESELKCFEAFLKREKLGSFKANQCEVAYINHIFPNDVWESHGDLEKIVTVFHGSFGENFLLEPEDARIKLRFRIPDASNNPIGRLYVAIDPGYHHTTEQPIFIMSITARGFPSGNGLEGVMDFMDLGRESVVRAFASLTTDAMHVAWGRRK